MAGIQNGSGTKQQKVQLGCGTLILIALIVTLFSGRGRDEQLRTDIRSLDFQIRQGSNAAIDEVRRTREEIEKLGRQLEQVQNEMKELSTKVDQVRNKLN